jgi:hypothetical protein
MSRVCVHAARGNLERPLGQRLAFDLGKSSMGDAAQSPAGRAGFSGLSPRSWASSRSAEGTP